MMANKINKSIVITGIICIALLMGLALCLGFDGILLTTVIGIIALAIGITIPGNKIIK